MIHFVLSCILWAKPNLKLIEVPVDEFAMATIETNFNQFRFQASVIEERMNSVKIVSLSNGYAAEAYSPMDSQLKSLAIQLSLIKDEAKLDCEVKTIP